MELRTLRSFLAVAREGNVTRAARLLHITQPALSRQLLDLERELGCDLLVREPRGVTLTEEGIILRKRAEEILDLADRAEQEVRTPSAQVAGDVWVGGGESRAMETVARVAARLSVEHPGIRLRLYSGNGSDVMDRMENGLLDFGIIMGDAIGPGYECLGLGWSDSWGVLMRNDHPLAARERLSLDDLRGERVIVSSQSHIAAGVGEITQVIEGYDMDVIATYTLLYNASLLVEAGAGVAICFDGIIPAGDGTPFAYRPLIGLPITSSVVAWKRHQPLSRAAGAFLAMMREECGA